jgi:hypothetical protein
MRTTAVLLMHVKVTARRLLYGCHSTRGDPQIHQNITAIDRAAVSQPHSLHLL